ECVLAEVLESEAGADDEVDDCAGNEHLVCGGERGDACPEMHGDTSDVVSAEFDLAGVYPGAGLDSEVAYRVADRTRAADRSCRSVEGRQDPIPGLFHDLPSVP